MKTQTYDRLAAMGITLSLFIGIFIAKDRFNFLSYTSNPMLSAIKANNVQEIGIDDGKQTSQLIQIKSVWYVKKDNQLYKADQDRINTLLESIATMKKNEVVSIPKSDQEKYGIGTHKITVVSSNNTFSLYIGNSTNLSRNYVRIDEENKVFLAEGFSDVFAPEDYRDMSIGIVNDESRVDNITFKGEETTKLTFNDNDWFINDKKLGKERVSFFINDLKTLKADDIVINPENLSSPEFTIQVMEDDQIKEAKFYNLGDYYLVKIADNNLYRISKANIDPLKKTESEFLQ